MPSARHEAIVMLFRENPALAVDLLRDAFHVDVPEHARAILASETLRQLEPVELAADAVVVLERDRPVLAIVVEAQLGSITEKRFSWPVYLALVRRAQRCPVIVLVIAPDGDVARQAEQPIEMGPGSVLTPYVLGPARVPRIVDDEEASAHVELAVLSAITHGRDDVTLEVVRPALAAVARSGALDEERRDVYADLVLAALGDAARAALEALMKSGRYEYQSEFARRYISLGRSEGLAEGKAEGLAEGKAEGLAEGKAEGLAEGKAEGKAAGEAEALLAVLAARGIAVAEPIERRVRACRDPRQLDRWLRRAAVATRLEDVFEDG